MKAREQSTRVPWLSKAWEEARLQTLQNPLLNLGVHKLPLPGSVSFLSLWENLGNKGTCDPSPNSGCLRDWKPGKVVWWVKVLAVKSGDLSSIPRVGGENPLLEVVLWFSYLCCGTDVNTHTHVIKLKIKSQND